MTCCSVWSDSVCLQNITHRHASLNNYSTLLHFNLSRSASARALASRFTRQSRYCRLRRRDACRTLPPPLPDGMCKAAVEGRVRVNRRYATNVLLPPAERCACRHGSRGHLAESLTALSCRRTTAECRTPAAVTIKRTRRSPARQHWRDQNYSIHCRRRSENARRLDRATETAGLRSVPVCDKRWRTLPTHVSLHSCRTLTSLCLWRRTSRNGYKMNSTF